LSTLRHTEGEMPLLKYYDEIEKKLTLLTNKTLMSYDAAAALVINEKYRSEALQTFVSGLKKSLKVAVFPSQPKDLPTALAIAQEAEASNDRYAFAANYAKYSDEKIQRQQSQKTQGWRQTDRQY
ncbi:hypothetical protein KR093_004339, partial [Drosophila rubida]